MDTTADIAAGTSVAPPPEAARPARKRIGEILIERGRLDAAGLDRALRMQQETGEKIGSLLVTLGIVAQRDVAEALAAQLELPLVEAAGYPELPILEERISARFLREARALPLSEDEHELALAMALHELCTNAVKYGALKGDQGLVSIDWHATSASGTARLSLRWAESGGPPVQEPTKQGFGSLLLRSLAEDLDARVDLHYLSTGVLCTIDVAL